MLAEHHDIDHEFPEFHAQYIALRANNPDFAALVDHHDRLDNDIRELEERQIPVADATIEQMKFERTALKDQIYQHLRQAQSAPPSP